MSFQDINQFINAFRARSLPPSGYFLLPDQTYAKFGSYNGQLAVGIQGSPEAPNVPFPLEPSILATAALVAKLPPTNAVTAWNNADAAPASQSRKASMSNFDKQTVYFKNYEVGEYFAQLSISADDFATIWGIAYSNHPELADDLVYVASAAKLVMGDWAPLGCGRVIAAAQNRHRDEKGDTFHYAEVAGALLTGVARHYGKPARFIPLAATPLAPSVRQMPPVGYPSGAAFVAQPPPASAPPAAPPLTGALPVGIAAPFAPPTPPVPAPNAFPATNSPAPAPPFSAAAIGAPATPFAAGPPMAAPFAFPANPFAAPGAPATPVMANPPAASGVPLAPVTQTGWTQ